MVMRMVLLLIIALTHFEIFLASGYGPIAESNFSKRNLIEEFLYNLRNLDDNDNGGYVNPDSTSIKLNIYHLHFSGLPYKFRLYIL